MKGRHSFAISCRMSGCPPMGTKIARSEFRHGSLGATPKRLRPLTRLRKTPERDARSRHREVEARRSSAKAALVPAICGAKLGLGALQCLAPACRQLLAGAIEVEGQHRQGGAVRIGFAPPAALRRALERAGDALWLVRVTRADQRRPVRRAVLRGFRAVVVRAIADIPEARPPVDGSDFPGINRRRDLFRGGRHFLRKADPERPSRYASPERVPFGNFSPRRGFCPHERADERSGLARFFEYVGRPVDLSTASVFAVWKPWARDH